MNRVLKKVLATFTIVTTSFIGATVYASEPVVVGTILGFNEDSSLGIVKEAPFDTVKECWDFAVDFNTQAKGTGYVFVCWPHTAAGSEV